MSTFPYDNEGDDGSDDARYDPGTGLPVPNPIPLLRKDLREAAKSLTTPQIRYLVDVYYGWQGFRIAAGNQASALGRTASPHLATMRVGQGFDVVDEAIAALVQPGDLVVTADIPDAIRKRVELWIGCIAGALRDTDYRAKLAAAGFEAIDLEATRIYAVEDARQFLAGQGVDVDAIAAQVHACYAGADAFLRITPGMAMEHLSNVVRVGPIAAVGSNRRDELNHHLRLAKQEKLVLVSLGGIAGRLPIERWPRVDGVRWLVQQSWQAEHPDAIALESLPMSFSDLLASCDVLLCKPGYGSFAEAACSGTPVLYVSRADWPESPALIEWLQRHGLCREVSRDALEQGDFAEVLEEICDAPHPEPVIPEGAGQVTDWIAERLQR